MPTHSTYSSSVDVATGAVLSYGFDFYLNGVIPLEIERLWFSDSDFSGRLGYGVHSILDIQLKIDEESIELLTKIIAPHPEYQSKPEDNALYESCGDYLMQCETLRLSAWVKEHNKWRSYVKEYRKN